MGQLVRPRLPDWRRPWEAPIARALLCRELCYVAYVCLLRRLRPSDKIVRQIPALAYPCPFSLLARADVAYSEELIHRRSRVPPR